MAKAKKQPAAQPALVVFVLDKSSSMSSCYDSTVEAFNGYLNSLRETPNLEFSLVQFCTMSILQSCTNAPIKSVPALSRENYRLGGSTPLIEAATKTIEAAMRAVAQREVKPRIVVCIQTDGQENSSGPEYTNARLAGLISQCQEMGWEFNFMGAGINGYAQANQWGIGAAHTMSYNSASPQATRKAFASRGHATAMYASGLAGNMSIGAAEKWDAGDAFDPDALKLGKTWAAPKVTSSTKATSKTKPSSDITL